MEIRLLNNGTGILPDAEPRPVDGKVFFTISGNEADAVCIGGRFYPIESGRATVASADIYGTVPLTVYRFSDQTRYVCPSLCFFRQAGEQWVGPAPEDTAARLGLLQAEWQESFAALKGRVAALEEKVQKRPISFGGKHEEE